MCLQYKSFENTVGKGDIARNEQCLIFPQCFLPVWGSTRLEQEKLLVTSNFFFSHSVFYLFEEISSIFIQFEIVVCKLFQFEVVWNLSFGKGLKAPVFDW